MLAYTNILYLPLSVVNDCDGIVHRNRDYGGIHVGELPRRPLSSHQEPPPELL
jgi:hypothetical protein